jgi:hypothetical protein
VNCMRGGQSARDVTAFCVATTDDGVALPVVDITNPAFACEHSEAELAAIAETTRRGIERSRKLPAFVLRLMARRSVIMRAMLQADRGFVSGMTTYLFKIGPDRLPHGYGSGLDRRMLGVMGPVACRLRLRQMARQLADAAAPVLAGRGGPLLLVSIAGGVAADSLNALILLQKERPDLLARRPIRIVVLDVDREGPAFGERACAALTGGRGPLAGLSVDFSHVVYDWGETGALAEVLRGAAAGAVVIGSSEGGLFEYGGDEAVGANLAALRECTPADFAMVGSLIRDDTLRFLTAGPGAPTVHPRGLTAFGALVARAGWAVARTTTNPLYHIVTMLKAGD